MVLCHLIVHFGFFSLVPKSNIFSQIQSFEAELAIPEIAAKEGGSPSFRGVFIRAPAIIEVGPEVEVLADIPVASEVNINSGSAHESQEVCF